MNFMNKEKIYSRHLGSCAQNVGKFLMQDVSWLVETLVAGYRRSECKIKIHNFFLSVQTNFEVTGSRQVKEILVFSLVTTSQTQGFVVTIIRRKVADEY